MLAHETNFDDHLDALEDRSGHVFSLSRKLVKNICYYYGYSTAYYYI